MGGGGGGVGVGWGGGGARGFKKRIQEKRGVNSAAWEVSKDSGRRGEGGEEGRRCQRIQEEHGVNSAAGRRYTRRISD